MLSQTFKNRTTAKQDSGVVLKLLLIFNQQTKMLEYDLKTSYEQSRIIINDENCNICRSRTSILTNCWSTGLANLRSQNHHTSGKEAKINAVGFEADRAYH